MVRTPNQTAEKNSAHETKAWLLGNRKCPTETPPPFQRGAARNSSAGRHIFTGRRWAARVCAHENEKTVLAMTPSCQSRLLAGSSEVPHPLPVFSIGRGSLRARGFGIGPPSQFELEMEKKSTHA